MTVALISYSRRLTSLAEQGPERRAITCGQASITRSELESAANRLARDLLEGGAAEGDMVTIALPNSVDWFIAFAACWKIGAVPQPVSAKLPTRELQAILELADPSVVIGVPQEPGRRAPDTASWVRARSRSARRSPPRCDLAGLEGTDFRRVDGTTQTHCLGRSGPVRSGRTTPLRQDGRLHGRSRPAVPQRSHRLVVLGLVGGQPRRRPASFRRRGHAGGESTGTGPTPCTWCPP